MGRKIATIVVGFFLLIMAAVPAGAEASSADRAQTNLSSLRAIEAYLSSMGVDPGSVVVQQGRWNYAGPNCPGDGWNCTTATMVVQISSSTLPAANIFDCLPAIDATFPALDECLIIQSSALSLFETASTMNSASCGVTDDSEKSKSKCTVRQSSKKGKNNAVVRQHITQRAGSSQSATESAEITQTSQSGSNSVKITQTIEQTQNIGTPGDPTQQQQARQTAKVEQTSEDGNNSSDVQQTILQTENAQSSSDITQEQNQNVSSPGPNQDAQITQTATGSGNNWSNLSGQLTQRQDADCVSCAVTQKQGVLDGGQKGKVDQSTVSGTSNQGAGTQVEDQKQETNTTGLVTQIKIGPQDCCATQVGGGSGNINTVTQSNVQVDNDAIGSSQTSEQNAHCVAASGQECTIDQTYTVNNGTPDHYTETGSVVTHDRFCNGAAETDPCPDAELE